MQSLKQRVNDLIARMPAAEVAALRQRLDTSLSVYPFNKYEYIISTLLGSGILSLEDYYRLRDEYIARNMYLYLFEISAPRGFGELWAQGHLKELVPDLKKPDKETDPDYAGQYDFLLHTDNGRFARIEVKASRAVDFESHEPLYIKALSGDEDRPFDMNFQQVKPGCCDVFVWIGVWRDAIRYWVFSSGEVEANKYYSSGQHRGNTGEGQLHFNRENLSEFAGYEVRSDTLKQAILTAYQRQTS